MAETWDATVPAGSRNPILGDDDIRSFKTAMVEILDDEHVMPSNGQATSAAKWNHKQITFEQTTSGSEPSTAADEVCLFQKDDAGGDPELFMRGESDGDLIQITDLSMTKILGTIIKNYTIGTSQLDSESVTKAKMADFSVGNSQLETGSVDTDQIADDAVTADQLADGCIDAAAKLASDVVTTAKILNDNVTADKLADGCIDAAAKLATGIVTSAKIGADAVNGSKIADDSIDSEHYVDASIDAEHLASDIIGPSKCINGSLQVIGWTGDVDIYGSGFTARAWFFIKCPSSPTAIRFYSYAKEGVQDVQLKANITLVGGASVGDSNTVNLTTVYAGYDMGTIDMSGATPGSIYMITILANGGDASHMGNLRSVGAWWE